MSLTILFLRHAEAVSPGTAGYADTARPLTARGHRDAAALAFSALEVAAVYSSPYARAVQTAEPLATRRRVGIDLWPDLRERMVAPEPRDDWAEQHARSWADIDYALPAPESNRDAQRRGLRAIAAARTRHADGTVCSRATGTSWRSR